MDKDIIKKTFGNNLKAERNRRNLSQEQLAELAGLSYFTHVGKIERGQMNPTLTTIVKLVRALDVDFNDLLDTRKLPPSGVVPE